ncbi:MAG: UvrD-helicase domain-containing protein [Bacteroidia bacterium]|nr:UvrD-helicase domain-containing protein [Bacteroidia bacterium]
MLADSILGSLNEAQRQAVLATEGPVMVLAGAGSGKTRVLTHRIAWLIHNGVFAGNILALTFTNKAAREMKDRISQLVGISKSKDIWMGTFHSVFAKILRIESERIGYPPHFTIYDTEDSLSVIKDIVKQKQLDDKIYKPSLILNRISDAKNKLISAEQYLNTPEYYEDDMKSKKPLLGEIFLEYQKRNFRSSAMDFDDLLFNTNILLRDNPDLLLKYQNKFRYILVDEYQDTNFSQYVIIRQLADRHLNICVVGDDAQSIYAFRGANIKNILHFQKDYPEAQIFKLEENYRSTQTIVNASNKIISYNHYQLPKNVYTRNERGKPIKVFTAQTDNEEGYKIANQIHFLHFSEKVDFGDVAILYRTNAQSRPIEEALRRLNLPYIIYGGIGFYQRKEIKDALAYFRLVVNPHDDESFKRVVNFPTRGIGQATLDKLLVASVEYNQSMFFVARNARELKLNISEPILQKLEEFTNLILSFQVQLNIQDAYSLGNAIITRSGLYKELHEDKTPEGVNRFDNLMELLNGLKEFSVSERTAEEKELSLNLAQGEEKNFRTLDEFLGEISLMTNADLGSEEDAATKIKLMTIHSAKGLEFNHVFVAGMEENLFPGQLSIGNREEMEEERRLFYVAVTRAKKECYLSYAKSRFKRGELQYSEPSRFLDELGEEYLEFENIKILKKFDQAYLDTLRKSFISNNSNPFSYKSTGNLTKPGYGFIQKKNSRVDLELNRSLQAGDIIFHEKFGKGKVIEITGSWPESRAIIHFETAGKKHLMLKFAHLHKTED